MEIHFLKLPFVTLAVYLHTNCINNKYMYLIQNANVDLVAIGYRNFKLCIYIYMQIQSKRHIAKKTLVLRMHLSLSN